MTQTKRPHWQGTPGRSSVLLCTTHRGRYQLVVHRAWWQSGSGCLTRDLIKTSPLGSGDPYNLHWRLRPGSCLDSHLPSNLLSGRKCLPAH